MMADKDIKVGIGDMKFTRGDNTIITAFGMMKNRTIVKIAGGAKMFEMKGSSDFGNIGQRNAAMVKKILMEERMRISAEDTGGTYARTMLLNVANGDVIIRTVGKPEKHL